MPKFKFRFQRYFKNKVQLQLAAVTWFKWLRMIGWHHVTSSNQHKNGCFVVWKGWSCIDKDLNTLFILVVLEPTLQWRCFCKHTRRYSHIRLHSFLLFSFFFYSLSIANWVIADRVLAVFSQIFSGSVSVYWK